MKAGLKVQELGEPIYFKNKNLNHILRLNYDVVKHLIGCFGMTKKMGFVVLAGALLDGGEGLFLNLTGFQNLSGL